MRCVLPALAALVPLYAGTVENVLLVVNRRDPASVEIGEYYRAKRAIPLSNVCRIETGSEEEIDWNTFESQVERPIADCLRKGLQERIFYIVTTFGVPLKVKGPGEGMGSERCAVDSELALLYGKLKGIRFARSGGVPNPFFGRHNEPFVHPMFPIYLVTRLAAYDVAEVKGMIDRGLAARNRGKFVIDLQSDKDDPGNDWLRTAAILIPGARVVLDETTRPVYDAREVIGYASWGSNDPHRSRRWLGFQWLPGGIATEFVSSDGRTFKRPPDTWTYTNWRDRAHFWAGTPQGLAADFIHEGASGASGNVYEPYLGACARPDHVLPAYYEGRNLAESFYLGMPLLSWQGIVLGDPLMSLGKPSER